VLGLTGQDKSRNKGLFMAITAIGLARYAREYFDSAKAADDVVGIGKGYEVIAPAPVMFLTAHAIELALKAYLFNKGKIKIKSFGHDINQLWSSCQQNGINELVRLNAQEMFTLKLISHLHLSTELRYIDTGFKTFPVFGPLENLAKKILDAICPAVGYK
jgi:HEPN domain-containing protein